MLCMLLAEMFSSFCDITVVSKSVSRWRGGRVVQRVERWTCDQQVVGSNPTRGKAA